MEEVAPQPQKLMGATATQGKSAMPGPAEVGAKVWQHLKDPFYDKGTTDKGIGIQLVYAIAVRRPRRSTGGFRWISHRHVATDEPRAAA